MIHVRHINLQLGLLEIIQLPSTKQSQICLQETGNISFDGSECHVTYFTD
jgi:hypothetical protein